jgi:hypothetical protein
MNYCVIMHNLIIKSKLVVDDQPFTGPTLIHGEHGRLLRAQAMGPQDCFTKRAIITYLHLLPPGMGPRRQVTLP